MIVGDLAEACALFRDYNPVAVVFAADDKILVTGDGLGPKDLTWDDRRRLEEFGWSWAPRGEAGHGWVLEL